MLLFLLVLSYIGAKIAMKVQYLIMAIVALSLVSFFLGRMFGLEGEAPEGFGGRPDPVHRQVGLLAYPRFEMLGVGFRPLPHTARGGRLSPI